MTITGKGHWDGDPTRHCEELTLRAESADEREQLALLLRVLSARCGRELLLEAAETVERCAAPEVALVGC